MEETAAPGMVTTPCLWKYVQVLIKVTARKIKKILKRHPANAAGGIIWTSRIFQLSLRVPGSRPATVAAMWSILQ
jgi:hypothetical protein